MPSLVEDGILAFLVEDGKMTFLVEDGRMAWLRDVSRKNQFLPGTIRPGRFAQKIERDGSRKKTGTIRSKSNLEVDSPILY